MSRRNNLLIFLLCTSLLAAAAERPVDAGTFGVWVNGKRAATEKFEIRQGQGVSSARSEFRETQGKHALRSEMQIAANGSLVRYEFRELSPGKAMAIVEPAEAFLIQRNFSKPNERKGERPYVMPHSTAILDDFFFSHRQMLLWRYLAQACGGGKADCRPGKAQFGAIIPQQQSAFSVTVEYVGPERVTIAGAARELDRFNLTHDDGDAWAVWMDKQYRVHRMVAADGTEVVRE